MPGESALDNARARLSSALGDDPARAEVLARFDRWAVDLVDGIAPVYDVAALLPRLVDVIAKVHRSRSATLRGWDRRRLLEPDWFQRSDAIGYVAYTDLLAGTLAGVRGRIDHLESLGVTSLHLMPLLAPRPGENDGGYAVMDYRAVRSDLGTIADLAALADDLHSHGIALTLDLVLNHVAREHDWAVRARAGDPRYRAYFRVFPDRDIPDAYEETLPEVFPAFAPGNFTFDEDVDGWVWTTFNAWQWDLDWSNPDVFLEFADIIGFLANAGADCIRLDAIAFIWKRLGTTSQNEQEVHAITQALRAATHIMAPAVVFKAEAIVGPQQVVHYLGQGEHAGKVSDLAYHNSLMVQIWSALAARDARLMATALSRFRPVPVTTAWATYLRCHDDIGWAIDDLDAAAVGWDGAAHRAFLAGFYAGEHPGSFARGAHFQSNPLTGDRRTSGSAASLAGIQTALASGDTEALRLAEDRLHCAYAMVYGFGGLPLLYMGDEVALLNDEGYADDPRKAADNRWLHRPSMDWAATATPDGVAARMLARMRHLADVRRSLPALHAATTTEVAIADDPAVILFRRRHAAGSVVEVYNVSERERTVDARVLWPLVDGPEAGTVLLEHLSGQPVVATPLMTIPAYCAWWLTSPS